MRLLKTILIGLAAFCLMLAAVGCPNGIEGSGVTTNVTDNDGGNGGGNKPSGGQTSGLTVPSNVTAVASATANHVIIKWTDNGAAKYWVYKNTVKDTSSAVCMTREATSGENGYDVALTESGTYFFWVVAAEGSKESDKHSSFGTPASYTFALSNVTESLTTVTGLTVVKGSEKNTVAVSWTASSDGKFYHVFYNNKNDSNTASHVILNGSDKGITDTSFIMPLTADGTYYFWVRNADSSVYTSATKVSQLSTAASYAFTFEGLKAPTDVKVTEYKQIQNTVNVTWKGTGEQVCYYVFYSKTNDSSKATLAKSYMTQGTDMGTGGNSFPAIILSESGTYYFWVLAGDAERYSQVKHVSDFSSATAYEFTFTAAIAPTDLNVTASDATDCVTLSWKNNSNCSYWWIYVGTENDSSKAKLYDYGNYSSVREMRYNVALTGNGTYYFWVRDDAYPDYVMGDNGSPVEIRPSASVSPFSEAKSFTFSGWKKHTAPKVNAKQETGKNKVTVSWSADNDMVYYIYQGKTNDSSKAELVNTVSMRYSLIDIGNTQTYTATLAENGTYYFWVKADNYFQVFKAEDSVNPKPSANASDFGTPASVEFKYKKLDAPTDVTADQITYSKNTVRVRWKSTGADYYWLYYSTTNDTKTAVMVGNGTYDSYIYGSYYEAGQYMDKDVKLTDSGTYYFWVRSDSGYNQDYSSGHTVYSETIDASDFSAAASCQFIYTPLDAPTGVTVTKGTGNKVTVKWSENGSSYYWIYYNTSNNTATATCATRSAYSWSASEGYSITLTDSGTYYFWVKAADDDNIYSMTSSFSTAASINFTYTALEAPKNVKAEKFGAKSIKVTWDKTNAAYYGVYLTKTNEFSNFVYSSRSSNYNGDTTSSSVRVTEDGTYYVWVAFSDDEDSLSSYSLDMDNIVVSQPVTFNYKYEPLAAPTGLKAAPNDWGEVNLSWTSTNAPYYWVYISSTDRTADAEYYSGYSSASANIGMDNRDYGTYYFWVRAADEWSPNSSNTEYSDFSESVSYVHRSWTADDVDQIIFYDEDREITETKGLTNGVYTVDMSEAASNVTMRFAFAINGNSSKIWNYYDEEEMILMQTKTAYSYSFLNAPFVFTFVKGNTYQIVFYADYENNQWGQVLIVRTNGYKVHFDCGVGDSIDDVTTDGTPITKPNNYIVGDVYTFSGKKYKFGGWVYQYDENDYREYDFTSYVNEDITLYAIWTPKVTVTFDMNGHGEQLALQEIWSGNYVNIPSTYEKGYDYEFDGDYYRFGGWYNDSELDDEYSYDTIYADTVLYAKWTYIAYHEVTYIDSTRSYNQTYDTADGDTAWNVYSGEFDVGEDYEINDTKYTFGGWYTEDTFENRYLFDEAVTDNIILYAKWTEVQ